MSPKIEVLNSSGRVIPKKFLLGLHRTLLPHLSKKLPTKRLKALLKKDLVILFVNRSQARKLNKDYRRRNYATDVLSFAPIEESSLGELVFCYEVVKAQAADHGLSFRFELTYLFIHGVLHLLGFDHEKSKAEERKMYAIQDQLFETLMLKLV